MEPLKYQGHDRAFGTRHPAEKCAGVFGSRVAPAAKRNRERCSSYDFYSLTNGIFSSLREPENTPKKKKVRLCSRENVGGGRRGPTAFADRPVPEQTLSKTHTDSYTTPAIDMPRLSRGLQEEK
eukprot:scaffold667923_cov36-Prasinocladus_malaysianus.AAC.1